MTPTNKPATENMSKLSYRPGEMDDWGDIRNESGALVLKVSLHARGYQSEGDLAIHRIQKTDPCKEYGEKIVRAVNSHDALVEALKFVKANAIFPLGMAKGITGTDPWDIVDEALKLAEGK